MKRIGLVFSLLFLLALPRLASAKDEACVDGVNCLCDTISSTYPSVVFCEDWEKAAYDTPDTGAADEDATYASDWAGQVSGCFLSDGIPNNGIEGTCATCCVNIVTEGACEVSSQTDCVFQGTRTFGHRFNPGQNQGNVGSRNFPGGVLHTNMGITMAVKYSRNYVLAEAPKKTDEFSNAAEQASHCVLGCGSGTILPYATGTPYHGSVFTTSTITGATAAVGQINTNSTAFRWAPSVWNFNTDWGQDVWGCRQFEIDGINTQGGRIRDWFNGTLKVDVQNVDLTKMSYAADGIVRINLDNYSNDDATGNVGYPGSTVAYRYEDNIVVTSGTPVPCSAIGFGSIAPPTDPAISLSTVALAPNVSAGSNATAASFSVSNTGAGTLSYSLSDDMSWLTLSPTSGTSTGEADTIGVTYSTAALSPGTYTGTITVACSGTCTNSGQTIAVSLTVTAVGVLGSLHANISGAQGLSASNWVWATYASGWTWEAMFKADTTTNSWKRLLSTKAATPDPNSSCWFAEDTSGKTRFEVAGSVTAGVQSTNTISSETSWHRYSLTFSGGTYTEYIDGTQVGQSTGKSNPTSASDGPIRLNDCYLDNGSALGRVADVRLLSAAKNSTWITQHKDCRLKPGTAGLVDYWRLDEVSGTTVANTATTPTHGNITLSGGLVMDNGDTPALAGVAGSDCVDAANPVPTITTSVSTLSPSTTAGANASPESFTVTNTGGGTAVYSVSDDVTWMSQSPAFATTTAETDTVSVTYDAASLTAAGSPYTGHIYLYDPSANPDTKTITVTMTVNAPAPAQITLSPTTLSPAPVTVGSSPSAGSFSVRNTGSANLTYTISDNQSWLSESPDTGTSTGESDTITVTYATTGLSVGTHQATITVTDAAAVPTSQTLTVTVVIQAAAPTINLSTSTLSAVTGVAPAATFQVRNTGGGTLSYTITSATPWISSISPASGGSSGESDPINVYINTTGMAPGTYAGSISVADTNATNTPQTINVSLTIATAPVITVSPTELTASAIVGSANLAYQSFIVRNSGTGTLTYTISDNASWLSVSPASGTSTGESDTIVVTLATSALNPGQYTGTITVTDIAATNSPRTVTVNQTITQTPPEPQIPDRVIFNRPTYRQGPPIQ